MGVGTCATACTGMLEENDCVDSGMEFSVVRPAQ